jgi:hypothetical protein
MDVRLVNLRVTEDPFNRVQSVKKEILAQFLKTGTRYRGMEVDTLEKRVDLNGCLSRKDSAHLARSQAVRRRRRARGSENRSIK